MTAAAFGEILLYKRFAHFSRHHFVKEKYVKTTTITPQFYSFPNVRLNCRSKIRPPDCKQAITNIRRRFERACKSSRCERFIQIQRGNIKRLIKCCRNIDKSAKF